MLRERVELEERRARTECDAAEEDGEVVRTHEHAFEPLVGRRV